MWTRTRVLARIALIVLGSAATAESATLVGTPTAVNEGSVQVSRAQERERTLRTTRRTKYVKWIIHQPWQESPAGGERLLAVGRCVSISARSADAEVADLIRVSSEPRGTIWNPCRRSRISACLSSRGA
jgi:hypothetical protein